MSAPLGVRLHAARYECGGPCVNCREPIVRLVVEGSPPSLWLHTPNRLPCINHLTRELRDTVAEQREPWLARPDVDAVSAARFRMRRGVR